MATNKRSDTAIRVGDQFRDASTVWTITEVGLFGRWHWVISEDRCRQAVFNRATLERMTRIERGA